MLAHDFSQSLFEIGAIKTGQFTLKSGQNSPVYIDLRNLVSMPELLDKITDETIRVIGNLEFDCICGVPYTAIPIATLLSYKLKKPLILKRKEMKTHGTRRIVEGIYKEDDKCLVIEDIVTSGLSILETIKSLEEVKLQVSDCVCLIDREQGGKAHLLKNGYHLHSVTTLVKVLDQLEYSDRINHETVSNIKNFLRKNPYQET